MKIKSGDTIKVLAGKDKGKTAKVLQVFAKKNKVSVEGVNLLIKHMRSNKRGEKGQRVQFSSPMSVSNLILVCGKCKKTTRVGCKMIDGKAEGEDGKKSKSSKIRVCKKCGEKI